MRPSFFTKNKRGIDIGCFNHKNNGLNDFKASDAFTAVVKLFALKLYLMKGNSD